MKNLTKRFGIIVFTAMIIFSMAACSNSSNSDGGGGGGSLGETYTGSAATVVNKAVAKLPLDFTHIYVYAPKDDEELLVPLSSIGLAKQTVAADGKFTLKLGTPNKNSLISIDEAVGSMGFTISDRSVNIFQIECFFDEEEKFALQNIAADESKGVEYIYADGNVKVTGTHTGISQGQDWSQEFALDLKKGWNTVIWEDISDTKGKVYTGNVPSGVRWEISPVDND
jgi:hypothetical protein